MSAAAAVRMGPLHDRDQLWFGFLTKAAEGDRDAFAALYDATSSLVYSLVLRILNNPADAEEVTLDVYIQAWRDAKRFDSSRGGVGAWLVTIARSRALDRIRAHESRQKREALPLVCEIQSNVPSPEDLSAMSQDRRAVSAAMAALSAEQREVIELAYFRGMSQSEMAEHLKLPLGTVKTRVRLAMIRLRELIGGWKA
ncbi:MAG: sigma-70 family RNA polymerase sigma factor [Bryobacterales bacterium]|nr:sigma-70 family RNA polymerase sigma factor [Bryobacterales bacterium]